MGLKRTIYCLCAGFLLVAEALAADPVRVGVLAPLSGEMEEFGKKALEGILLALEAYPKEHLEVVVENVGTGATTGVAKATSKLLAVDKVSVIIGAFFLDQTLVAAPLTERAQVPLVSLTLCARELQRFRYTACSYPSVEEQLSALGELLKKLGVRDLATVFESSSYGAETERVLLGILRREEVRVIDSSTINPSDRELRAVVTKIVRHKPAAVFVTTADPGQSFALFKQLREQGFQGQRIGFLDIDPKYLIEFGESIEGVFLPGFLSPNFHPRFYTRFEARYGRKPNMYNASAFDVANIVALTALTTQESGRGFMDLLHTTEYANPAVSGFRYRSDRTVSVPVKTLVIRNREYVEAQ